MSLGSLIALFVTFTDPVIDKKRCSVATSADMGSSSSISCCPTAWYVTHTVHILAVVMMHPCMGWAKLMLNLHKCSDLMGDNLLFMVMQHIQYTHGFLHPSQNMVLILMRKRQISTRQWVPSIQLLSGASQNWPHTSHSPTFTRTSNCISSQLGNTSKWQYCLPIVTQVCTVHKSHHTLGSPPHHWICTCIDHHHDNHVTTPAVHESDKVQALSFSYIFSRFDTPAEQK